MKKTSKFLCLMLALTMIVSVFAACKGDKPEQTTVDPNASGQPSGSTGTKDDDKVYTLRDVMSAGPQNWNPHAWETNADNYFSEKIEMPFITITKKPNLEEWEWFYETATSITDVTKDFADKKKWGIPENQTADRVYEIKLRKDLEWANGEKIDADAYIYSMQQLLSSEMKNYRANTFFKGSIALVGAEGYYYNDRAGVPRYVNYNEDHVKDGSKVVINTEDACIFFGGKSMKDQHKADEDAAKSDPEKKALKRWEVDVDGQKQDFFVLHNKKGFVEVTDKMKAQLLTIAKNFGDNNEEAWKEFCFTAAKGEFYKDVKWEDVGLLKKDDYTLQYILVDNCNPFYFKMDMTGSWLVNKKLYEANKKKVENLTATSYNTSAETTSSFGPYKLVSFEVDKQYVLERNEKWYGYKDDRYKGQFMTDRITVSIQPEHSARLMSFQKGELDFVGLTSDDMQKYRMSAYLMQTDETYTWRWIFATSLESLKSLEQGGADNKRILHYKDFRKAISLSMDRAKFCKEGSAGYKPAFYLLNSLYFYDIENNPNSVYRNSTEAKEAVLRLYGIEYGEGKKYKDVDEAYKSVTGYDVEAAKKLFVKAYEQAKADGNYKDGQTILIEAMVSAASQLSPDDTKQQNLMNEFVDAATKGTPLEGKIRFEFKFGDKKRYESVALGRSEMIRGAWGGAAFYPFSSIRVYVDPEYMGGLQAIHESNGWNPATSKLAITAHFDGKDKPERTVEKTFKEWSYDINQNEFYLDPKNVDMRLKILSELESGILETYQCIPWGTMVSVSLRSMKVEYPTYNYNIMYGYGGLRFLTYNYDDKAWDAFVAEQNGQLKYE